MNTERYKGYKMMKTMDDSSDIIAIESNQEIELLEDNSFQKLGVYPVEEANLIRNDEVLHFEEEI